MLEIQALSAGYGKLQVLYDLSLAVEPGQFIGIFGPNGSGKSTLIKSIFGLADIFGGTILLEGRKLNGVPTEKIGANRVAYVPQVQNVFASMTIRENLRLAARRLPPDELAQALTDAFAMFPILEERFSQRAGQLSGGERQMLAIAMGFLAKPRLLLLDEPSAGLSPRYMSEIFRQLRALQERGITLVVVEQNARSLLRWCDYGYVLREGRIVFQGLARAILDDEETAKSYLGVGPVRVS